MSEIRALLLTDVVDSTQLAGTLGDEAMAVLWAAHDRLARALLPGHGGREIDKTDGMLLMFSQTADAVRYAAAYHQALAGLSPPLKARAGLHVGPVILRENPADDVARGAKPLEVDGMAKPTAARVMALAQGGQTLLSTEAMQALQAEDAAAGTPHSHGHWRLKGVSDPVELFEVVGAGAAPFATPPDGDKAYRVVRVGERWLPVRQLPNNLPQQTTSFLGRERELDEVIAALKSTRLVTLLGMGGLGKTRLSLQVAVELLAEYPDGAWFLDLSPLREPSLVVEEAARLLQVQAEPGRPLLQTLCAQVRERRLLLVIDNCEHLIAPAAALAHALLQAAPDVRLLASSREALRVPGERTFPVLPLPLPGAGTDRAALRQSTAVRLFVERAQSHRPDFAVPDEVAAQVAELVTRLEGIPLALELAAARVRSLSVADINARLKDRYKLLTGGSRVLQERQQTLRALVAWSYDLLQPDEQTLLNRLGVFSGGFDLAAAEGVCGADPLDPLDVVDLLSSLVEKSLVMPDVGSGGTRYRMLETLRDYALEKLRAGPDATETARRHLEHCFELAKQARNGMQGPDQGSWLDRLELEQDNLRAAMRHAQGPEPGADAIVAVKMAVALQNFWIMRGGAGEGRAVVQALLQHPAVAGLPMARAHALYTGAALALTQGDVPQALAMLQDCLALRRDLDAKADLAATLSTLAVARLSSGDADGALAAATEAVDRFRDCGYRVGEAIALLQRGQVQLHRAQFDDARTHLQAALALARDIGHPETEGEAELSMGDLEMELGDDAQAQGHVQRSLTVCGHAGDRRGEVTARWALGRLDLAGDRLEAAQGRLREALAAFDRFEMRSAWIGCLEDLATVALKRGVLERACTLYAAAQRRRDAAHLARPPRAQARWQIRVDQLRSSLGQAGFDVTWTSAQALETAQVQALALDTASTVPA
jgi:predicted ATPase/class 3 adenylate cyclase